MKCLICKKEIKPFHTFKDKAVFNKPVNQKTRGDTFNMSLGYCDNCKHISSDACSQKHWSEIEKTIYQELYASFTPGIMSPTQQKYTLFLYKWLNKMVPKGKVLEIGSHDGYFLKMFKDDGWLCKGVEPSPAAEIAKEKYDIETIHDFFQPEQFADENFDLVILKHVIEHVSNPFEFTLKAASLIKKGGYLYIELPNSYISLHECYFPEFHVDHLSYFTLPSIEKLINKIGGLEITHLESTWAHMKFPFIHILAKKTERKEKTHDKYLYLISHSIKMAIKNFKDNHQIYLKNLRSLAKKYKKIALWGAGSCGTQFAIDGQFKKDKLIVVDPNKTNHNKYLTVTGHLVHDPFVLKDLDVDVILVASGWEDDIVQQINHYTKKQIKVIRFYDLLKS